MPELNFWAIVVAAVAAVIVAGVYYAVFGKAYAAMSPPAAAQDPMPAWLLPVEFVRSLVLAAVVAGVGAAAGVDGIWPGVLLAAVLWVGFPAVLLSGSAIHEKVPWRLAALHAGDWLLKLLAIGVIVGGWQ